MKIFINKKCRCLRGKRDYLKKGEEYLVTCFYQDNHTGEFKVEAITKEGWNVTFLASRFDLPNV